MGKKHRTVLNLSIFLSCALSACFIIFMGIICCVCQAGILETDEAGRETASSEDSENPITSTKIDIYGTIEYLGEAGARMSYYRDLVTDVMYIYHREGYSGGLCTVTNPQTGLPMTYETYCEMYRAAKGELPSLTN